MASFVAHDPADLVALTPIVLGFMPAESLVLLTFGPRPGGFHARVDLPADREAQQEVSQVLARAALTNRVECAAVLVFTEHGRRALRQARSVLQALLDAEVAVAEVVWVGAEELRTLENATEWSPPVVFDIDAHPFTARSVFEGRVVHGSREELAATLTPAGDLDAAAVADRADVELAMIQELLAGDRPRLEPMVAEALWVQGCLRRFVNEGAALTSARAGRLLALMQVPRLRDVAWTEMTHANAPAHVALWSDLVRRSPGSLRAPVAAMLAFAAWLAGDGALAWCAIDRCHEGDPGNSMANAVAGLLTAAVPPASWEQLPPTELTLFG